MSDPLVSVVIPTYNRADLVAAAINSVLGQTYSNIEVIVVDDGSTDKTEEVLADFGSTISVIKQANAGPAIARNRGIAAARGEIIAFLDSDDLWLPTKLARQVQSLDMAGPDAICSLCNCTVLYTDGSKSTTFAIADLHPQFSTGIWINPVEVLLNRFVLFNQAVIIRRAALEKVGYFAESLRFGEDYDLPFRLALEGPWTIIRDELVIYHVASPNSWANTAMREEVRLREDLVHIRSQMVQSIRGRPALRRLDWLAERELRRERRELSIARFGHRKLFGAQSTAKVLAFSERIRRGIFRRTPSYPRVEVTSIGTSPTSLKF